MLINIILLRTDQSVFVLVIFAEYISHDLLVERIIMWLPIFFILQLQVFFDLKIIEYFIVHTSDSMTDIQCAFMTLLLYNKPQLCVEAAYHICDE